MIEPFIFLIVGLAGLTLGSDFLIKGAKNLCEHYGISQLFFGLTLVSIGTSIPEIGVSVAGAIDRLNGIETSGLVIGDALGSALSQITLLVGILAFFIPLHLGRRQTLRIGSFLLAAIFLLFGLSMDGVLSRSDGLVLVMAYLGYLLYLFGSNHIKRPGPHLEINPLKNVITAAVGLSLVLATSNIVVESGLEIAQILGINQSIVGIFLIGVGTGLPELSVALVALRHKAVKISIGNLLGSNICDLLFSLGSGVVISGFVLEDVNLWLDIPILLLFSIFVIHFLFSGRRIDRREGIALVSMFVFYALIKIFISS